MATKDETLKMAIDFLDGSYEAHKVRKACQEALEQPAQELVAYMYKDQPNSVLILYPPQQIPKSAIPLYTHPAPSCKCEECGMKYCECGER